MIANMWGTERTQLILKSLIGPGFTYIFGAIIYSLQIPERFFAVRFDFIGQSHTIHHIFVVIASSIHEKAMLQTLLYDCDKMRSTIDESSTIIQ